MKICNLASGSKGNSTYIKAETTEILIDAGLTLFEMETRLNSIGVNPQNIYAILVTHEHSDHICSVQRFAKKYNCLIYIHSDLFFAKRQKFEGVADTELNVFYDQDFYINEITVSPVALSHDSCHCVGFSIYSGGQKFSIITDLGVFTQEICNHIAESGLVLIESNYDYEKLINGTYSPFLKRRILSKSGHLSNEDCANAVKKIAETGTRNFILGHLSEENNTEDLAFLATANALKTFSGERFSVEVATQKNISRIYNLRGEI